MEIAVVEEVPGVQVTRPGRATAPAATLYEIVRKLPEGATIELDHKGGDAPLALRAGRFNTSLSVLPVEDYPSMTEGNLPHSFKLEAAKLRAMIDRTRFAISTEETRYYLNGIYLHTAEQDGRKLLRAAATDGHRLARVEEDLPDGAAGMPGIIIPRKTIAELRKLAEETRDEIEFRLSDTKISFRIGGVVLTSKLIDGTFPDYERVIPKGNDKVLTVGRQAFADAVGRVAAISSERSRPVKLSLDRDHLLITASSAEQGPGAGGAGWRGRRLHLLAAGDRLPGPLLGRHHGPGGREARLQVLGWQRADRGGRCRRRGRALRPDADAGLTLPTKPLRSFAGAPAWCSS
jgi:DNA polymerase-3 subunit beta